MKMKSFPDYLIVFIWFFLTLMIFYSGHLYSNDTLSKSESALNVITKGSFEVSGYHGAWGSPGRDGKNYPNFAIGSILTMIPATLCYKTLSVITGNVLPKYILSAFLTGGNIIITALSGCLIFILLVQFNQSKRKAFLFANIMLFSTEMLQYSSTGWSEPAAFFWGLLGFAILSVKRDSNTDKMPLHAWTLWAVCSFMASLIRLEYTVFFLFFLVVHFFSNKTKWKEYLLPLCVLCFVIFIHLGYNFYRFESIFNFGYIGQNMNKNTSVISSGVSSASDILQMFNPSRYIATFYRTYISFGRVHWFWVSPLLALCPFFLLYRQMPTIIKQIFITACFYLVIIIAVGNNSWCWGNRYLYTVFPFLMFPVFFFPLNKKNVSIIFIVLSITGFIISLISSLINAHVVQEILVKKYGYTDAMWKYTTHFFSAPFWTHVKFFPEQFLNTIMLIEKGGNLPPWEVLRTDCLDIWPVGMCGAGANSFLSFGLWFLLVVTTILFFIKIIKPGLLRENRRS